MLSLYNQGDYNRVYEIDKNLLDDYKFSYEGHFSFDLSNLTHTPSFRRLTGKTQLLPELENEYFRNRLTHSLEVSDIAVKIAKKINNEHGFFKSQADNNKININLIRFSAHAHDLGHPPFGHKGEKALDALMIKYSKKYKEFYKKSKATKKQKEKISKEDTGSRFEGNAHNLRIICSLEKKFNYQEKNDKREFAAGINPTYRSIASILKYNNLLSDPAYTKNKNKGYFRQEAKIIKETIQSVTGEMNFKGRFRTIECNIMEFADDISYTVYDIEDVLKGRFISFLELTSSILMDTKQDERNSIYNNLVELIKEAKKNNSIKNSFELPNSSSELIDLLVNELLTIVLGKEQVEYYLNSKDFAYSYSYEVARKGSIRHDLASRLTNYFIENISVDKVNQIPALTDVKMDMTAFMLMTFLKQYIYQSITSKAKIQIVDYRGEEIVTTIFDTLYDHPNLLPDDFAELVKADKCKCNDSKILNPKQLRHICDYVASMTNRYAIEFYARLKSENHQSIFKPF
jgi:dGTPase